MAETLLSILPIIGFGGIVAAAVTFFGNFVIKEREYYIGISKDKMDAISKSKPYIVQLIRYYSSLSAQLKYGKGNPTKFDFPVCMYLYCRILAIDRRYLEEFGGLQLDDLQAEDILGVHSFQIQPNPLLFCWCFSLVFDVLYHSLIIASLKRTVPK